MGTRRWSWGSIGREGTGTLGLGGPREHGDPLNQPANQSTILFHNIQNSYHKWGPPSPSSYLPPSLPTKQSPPSPYHRPTSSSGPATALD